MAQLKDGTRVYGTFTANTEVVIGTLNVSTTLAAAFNTANAAYGNANSISSSANNYAGVMANGSGAIANAAFAAANQAGTVANNANTYADSTYVKKIGDTISGDLVVQGNVTISGVTTYANTQTLLIGDNIITLNNDLPAAVAPSEDAGIEIKRGSSANVSILWSEASDKWTFTNDGTNYKLIASNTDVESANNYAGAMANSANAYAASLTPDLSPAFNKANAAYTVANSGFDKANSANVLAYNTGIGANAYADVVGLSANNYAGVMANSVNAYTSATYATTTNATAAFDKANSANVLAKNAYDYANTISGGATVSDTAPSSPTPGKLWWNSQYGRLLVYYTDVDSTSQWVDATPSFQAAVNSIYEHANTKLANTSGVSFAGDLLFPSGGIGIGGLSPTEQRLEVGSSTTAEIAGFYNSVNDSSTVSVRGRKSRGSLTSPTSVSSGDGFFNLVGQGHDGTSYVTGARVYMESDGTPGTGSMPGRIVFGTTPSGSSGSTERMRIDSGGNVAIGTTSSGAKLHIQSNTTYDIMSGFYGEAFHTYRTGSGSWFHAGKSNASGGFTISEGATPLTSPLLTIIPGGNAGFGRTDPGYKVDVVGTVNASAILVNGVAVGGATIADETSSASTFYPVLTTSTSGSLTSANVSTSKLYFVPSTGSLSATTLNTLSDITLKTDVEQFDGEILLNKIDPVSFKWKDSGTKSYGVIAQELEKVLPELIETNDQGIKSVSYIPMIAMLVDVVKKQQKEIEEIKKLLNK